MKRLVSRNLASATVLSGVLAASALLSLTGAVQAQSNPECDNCYAGVNIHGDLEVGQGVSSVGGGGDGDGRYSVTFDRSLKHCVWNATVGNAKGFRDRHRGKFAHTIEAHARPGTSKFPSRTIDIYIHKLVPYGEPISYYKKNKSEKDDPWYARDAYFAPKDAAFMLVVHCFGSHVDNVNNPKRR